MAKPSYSELLVRKAAVIKAARTAIRLKHSLLADDEIAQKIPKLDYDIDKAIAQGRAFEFDPASVFNVD